jgi:predicted DNA-binding transcriptional regulator AlpA
MDKKFKHEKAIMSVSETATYLQLSRSRFYGLIAENVFPPRFMMSALAAHFTTDAFWRYAAVSGRLA